VPVRGSTVYRMDASHLIDIALANADGRRVEVMALEPAEFSHAAVGGLSQVVAELVGNAAAFSEPDEKVHVAGLFVGDSYLISISDKGVGIPGDLLGKLNRMLEDPDAAQRNTDYALGLRLVARLAARHGLAVRLVPGAPGTTARVTVPAALVTRQDPDVEQFVLPEAMPTDFTPHEIEHRVPVPAESARDETESFLESVFGALRDPWREPDRLQPAVLQVRVPGDSYSMSEDDAPSTAAAEAAIDIRSALSTFDQGRRSANLGAGSVEATA